ncbi:MAG TPA: tryptophan 2,3-dioxygenase family protein [Gemmatimonadaceae bacterium]|nr:tryptophan 2,3-dioxygenase family protein [Gemmatimonadaceae bacterium]
MTDDIDYPSYLALDELLALQRPLSKPEHPDELLFIVVHQSSELWFKVLLRDLDTLADALANRNGGLALWQLQRVNGLMRIVSSQLSSLALLPPQHFAAFRSHLGTSSGSQSAQFRAIEAASGLREPWFIELLEQQGGVPAIVQRWLDRPSLQEIFLDFLRQEGTSLEQLYLGPGPTIHFFVAEALLEYEMEFGQWRFMHAQLVERMLGPGTAGTGGSTGASMLHRTTGIRYFPRLAEVRARFFATHEHPR